MRSTISSFKRFACATMRSSTLTRSGPPPLPLCFVFPLLLIYHLQLRGLIITGRPGVFSGGLDVPYLTTLNEAQMREWFAYFTDTFTEMIGSRLVTICAISGSTLPHIILSSSLPSSPPRRQLSCWRLRYRADHRSSRHGQGQLHHRPQRSRRKHLPSLPLPSSTLSSSLLSPPNNPSHLSSLL